MRETFDLGIMLAYGLVVAVILLVGITAAWSVKPRRTVSLGVQTASDGSTHIIPGEGHVLAQDCMCRPWVHGLPPAELVEHPALRTVR